MQRLLLYRVDGHKLPATSITPVHQRIAYADAWNELGNGGITPQITKLWEGLWPSWVLCYIDPLFCPQANQIIVIPFLYPFILMECLL